MTLDVAALADLDRRRREIRGEAESLRARQKEIGKSIPGLDGGAREAAIAEAGVLAEAYKSTLAEADELDSEFDASWVALPNLTDPTAADGMTEDDNVEVRTWGDPVQAEWMKDHVELGEQHGFLDIERAAKVSGSRFGFMFGPMVRLELALVRWAFDVLEPHGFLPVSPPVLVREHALFGTGFFPGDREQVYSVDDDLYLVGTSEVSLAAMHADEILDARCASHSLRRVLDVFPARSGDVRQGHAGHIPGPPVRQARDVLVLSPRPVARRARLPARP